VRRLRGAGAGEDGIAVPNDAARPDATLSGEITEALPGFPLQGVDRHHRDSQASRCRTQAPAL